MALVIDSEAILKESRRLSHVLSTAPISPDTVCYRRLARRLAHLERLRFRMESEWRAAGNGYGAPGKRDGAAVDAGEADLPPPPDPEAPPAP